MNISPLSPDSLRHAATLPRRRLLKQTAVGFGSLALSSLLADEMAELLTRSPAAMLKWHGSFTIGDSLAAAFNNTQAVDQAARFILDMRRLEPRLGPAVLPDYAHLDSFAE